MQQGLQERAESLGLRFQAPKVLSNTRKAHIMSEYARDEGKLDALRRATFRANFAEGRNLADDGVLRDLAAEAGLDPDTALAAISDPRYVQRVDAAAQRSRALGITGVPAFIIEDKYKIVGAHPLDVLRDAFRRIADEQR